MLDSEKEIVDDKLTQSDLIKLMLHNAQHMATREEVKADIKELREELKLDNKLLSIPLYTNIPPKTRLFL